MVVELTGRCHPEPERNHARIRRLTAGRSAFHTRLDCQSLTTTSRIGYGAFRPESRSPVPRLRCSVVGSDGIRQGEASHEDRSCKSEAYPSFSPQGHGWPEGLTARMRYAPA